MTTTRHHRLRVRLVAASLLSLPVCFAAADGFARTALDLSDEIVIDGSTSSTPPPASTRLTEWQEDEKLFGFRFEDDDPDSLDPIAEESSNDSQWGFFNDINQIRLTWDANNLYVALNGIIWDNNVILLFDFRPGGMTSMTNLNSWRRNFDFQGILPDLFLATWDGNTVPQAWDVRNPNNPNSVSQRPEASFSTAATFSQGNTGRAMEAAIPWTFLVGDSTAKQFDPAAGDSLYPLPQGVDTLRIVAVVTAGADGTGGPDSAPDNLSGHTIESSDQVTVDNWAEIALDLDENGFPDIGVAVKTPERFRFHVRPPVGSLRLEIGAIEFDAPVIAPELGGELGFRFRLSPAVIPEDQRMRPVIVSADVFNLAGNRVRALYRDDARSASVPGNVSLDRWDGRDERGTMVPGGIYILRLVLEPDSDRKTKAFSVVR